MDGVNRIQHDHVRPARPRTTATHDVDRPDIICRDARERRLAAARGDDVRERRADEGELHVALLVAIVILHGVVIVVIVVGSGVGDERWAGSDEYAIHALFFLLNV